MADLFLRSTDGDNADNGTTWALAKATILGIATVDSAGDTIYISASHAESTAGVVNYTGPGTRTAFTRFLCVDDTADPASPTTLANTASIKTTGTGNHLTIRSNFNTLWHGVTFTVGDGSTGDSRLTLGSDLTATYNNCSFVVGSTSATQGDMRVIGAGRMEWNNCDVTFSGGASQKLYIISGSGRLHWKGGTCTVGVTSAGLFNYASGAVAFNGLIDGVDFSACPTGLTLVNMGTGNDNHFVFRNCKLPAGWTGALTTGTALDNEDVQMFSCDDGDTNYIYAKRAASGVIDSETTLVRTGGASDGTTPISWKYVTDGTYSNGVYSLHGPEIVRWNETVGSAVTATVEILHDSATDLTDQEVWIEVQYLGTSGFPLSIYISDRNANILATGTAQASSAETWTTTGMTNPNTQKLSVTFTPQAKGFIIATVHLLGGGVKTIYVDPMLTVT